MTRSYNSRKGHYGCRVCKGYDFESYEVERRGKQNRKRNELNFDDYLFTHKRSKNQRNGFWTYRYGKVYIDYTKEKVWKIKKEWFQYQKRSGKKWESMEVVRCRKEYLSWHWLTGKANVKGLRAPTGHR